MFGSGFINKCRIGSCFLIGDGVERQNLQQKATAYNLQRIRFLGYQEDVSGFYREASVVCLTSTFEGWGLCLTEAQANGVVPVAYDCGAGVREIISPSGVNGFLVSPFNQSKYARTLLKLSEEPRYVETNAAECCRESARVLSADCGKEMERVV